MLGGGVAGFTAVVTLLRHPEELAGSKVYWVEQADHAFPLQRGVGGRAIEPWAYEWPRPEWTWSGVAGPLRLGAATAEIEAEQWRQACDGLHHEQLVRHFSSVLQPEQLAGFPYDFTAQGLGKVSLILDCGGAQERVRFGDERTPGGNHVSYPFWGNDRLLLPDFELKGERAEILIAGGGDGAIQDLLRTLFGQAAPDLLRGHLQDLFPAMVTARIREIYEEAGRRLHYTVEFPDHSPAATNVRDERERHLQWVHDELADALSSGVGAVVDELERLYGERFEGRATPAVTVCHSRPYLGRCYPINHVLGILLKSESRLTRMARFRQDRVVSANVQGFGPEEMLTAAQCHGAKVDVLFKRADTATYNIVVNRTGARVPRIFPNLQPQQPLRHPGWTMI